MSRSVIWESENSKISFLQKFLDDNKFQQRYFHGVFIYPKAGVYADRVSTACNEKQREINYDIKTDLLAGSIPV